MPWYLATSPGSDDNIANSCSGIALETGFLSRSPRSWRHERWLRRQEPCTHEKNPVSDRPAEQLPLRDKMVNQTTDQACCAGPSSSAATTRSCCSSVISGNSGSDSTCCAAASATGKLPGPSAPARSLRRRGERSWPPRSGPRRPGSSSRPSGERPSPARSSGRARRGASANDRRAAP